MKLVSPHLSSIAKVSGYFLGFIPINSSINLESAAPEFMKIILNGNKSEGFTFGIKGDVHDNNHSDIGIDISGELVDNYASSYVMESSMNLILIIMSVKI